MSAEPNILSLIQSLEQQGGLSRHRRMMALSGEEGWAIEQGRQLVESYPKKETVWVGEGAPQQVNGITNKQARQLLGQECGRVVINCFSGFDPDVLGIVSGTLRGGGVLVLLTPPLNKWSEYNDPEYSRLLVAGYQAEEINGRFLKRLSQLIFDSDNVVKIQQDQQQPALPEFTSVNAVSEQVDPPYATMDQQQAVEAIHKVVRGHRRRPLVLTADRGRGKSAALGIAAARLIEEGLKSIAVTAPTIASAEAVFIHAQQLLPGSKREGNRLHYNGSVLAFYAPDQLMLEPPKAELVLVDEAAAIPAPLLESYLEHHSRIVFSTTVHGYEGTGRGFAIRFRKHLDEQVPGWNELKLKVPIRWAENDPLEAFIFKALCLDTEQTDENLLNGFSPDQCRFEWLPRERFIEDEMLLNETFGLLVNAHYRTTPSDLRNLLDGPNISVMVARFQGHVAGVLLLAMEGEFDKALAGEIFNGHRRPRGHMIPQTLASHSGIEEAACLKYARVMRIAIHPAIQNQGLGQLMIEQAVNKLIADKVDMIASSFSATTDLLNFWKKCEMLPVRVGLSREHTSGAHSVVVLKPLSSRSHHIYEEARKNYGEDLPYLLADPLKELEPRFAVSLLQLADTISTITLSQRDLKVVQGFAFEQRGYEFSLRPLVRYAAQLLSNDRLAMEQQQLMLLMMKVMQHHDWKYVAGKLGYKGRKGVLDALRKAIAVSFSD